MTLTGLIKTPLGVLEVRVFNSRITDLRFTTQEKGDPHLDPALKEIAAQIKQYFAGELSSFHLPVILKGTDFQNNVWSAVAKIPYGKTATYAQIASKIKKPTAVRAVGSAIAKNPVCLIIPCHRVIRSDGKIGGYAWGEARKRKLLKLENG